jgi:UDP:flavonoid glycosyltransferase YjiC (YdhE family)
MVIRRKVILATLGSAGDVHPVIALGEEMQRRGHDVVVITAELYGAQVRSAGLNCIGLGTVEAAQQILAGVDPRNVRQQLRASLGVLYYGVGPMYEAIRSQVEPERSLVIHNEICLGAVLAHEKCGVPILTMVLQPFSLRSAFEPLVFHPYIKWVNRLGRTGRRLFISLLHRFFFDRHVAPVVNAFRATLCLPPVSWRMNPHWWLSSSRILGLWPDWYGSRQPDWPASVALAGFVFHDAEAKGLAGGSQTMTTGDFGDKRPLVLAPGSWVVHGRYLFEAVVGACQLLQMPGVLVTRHADQVPERLPGNIRHVEYAPFSELFPRAAAVIHHGGVGTVAQALRAGCPQVCVPLGGDQHDNGARIVRLGAGTVMRQERFNAKRLAAELRPLLNSRSVAERCGHWRSQIDYTAAIRHAGDLIEEIPLNDHAKR